MTKPISERIFKKSSIEFPIFPCSQSVLYLMSRKVKKNITRHNRIQNGKNILLHARMLRDMDVSGRIKTSTFDLLHCIKYPSKPNYQKNYLKWSSFKKILLYLFLFIFMGFFKIIFEEIII